MKKTEFVSINGEIFKPDEAKISIFDRGFIYGDAIYEVVRSYDRIFFEIEPHIERLFNSAEMLAMDLKKSPEEYQREIYRIYSHSKNPNVYMRIQISRGTGNIGMHPKNVISGPNVVVWIRELDPIDPKHYSHGINLVTTQRIRNPKQALDPAAKSGNYLNNILGYFEAIPSGADDAIMINAAGQITEGTTFNVFMVKDGVIFGPPDDFDLLRGITRKVIKEKIAPRAGIKLVERGFSVAEMESADELFMTSSLKEVMPIWKLNGRVVRDEPGPVTKKLASVYKEYVEEYKSKMRSTYPWQAK